MDKAEARSILSQHLAPLKTLPYEKLAERIGDVEDYEVAGPSGARYQLSIQAMWDDAPNGDLRIIGAIDGGGWRAFFPLTDSFIMTPDGDLVGE